MNLTDKMNLTDDYETSLRESCFALQLSYSHTYCPRTCFCRQWAFYSFSLAVGTINICHLSSLFLLWVCTTTEVTNVTWFTLLWAHLADHPNWIIYTLSSHMHVVTLWTLCMSSGTDPKRGQVQFVRACRGGDSKLWSPLWWRPLCSYFSPWIIPSFSTRHFPSIIWVPNRYVSRN